jgi:alkanesulfonate monooxygenase SsuD/methylene tetrahydromethanopterin reductase-like flavin-dependent oxidoreductase (luciferase family)
MLPGWRRAGSHDARAAPEVTMPLARPAVPGFALRSGLPLTTRATVDLLIDAVDAGLAPALVTEVSGAAATVVTAAVAAVRTGAVLGTGIVPLGSRSEATLAMEAASIAGLVDGPVLLGVGVSSRQIVEGWHRADYAPTVRATALALEQLRGLLDGGRREGFALASPPGSQVQLLLGALGPRMLELAHERAAGAIVNLTPADALVAPPPGSQLLATVWVGACADADARVRREVTSYALAGPYGRHLERLGYGSVVATVQRLRAEGRLREGPAQIPDELIDRLFVDVDHLDARLSAYRDAGATPIVLPVTGDDPGAEIHSLLRRLAPSGT